MVKKVKKKVIVKVRRSKKSNQKTVTVPKSARHIKEGDYVVIRRI